MKKTANIMLVSLLCNIFLSLFKIIVGFFAKSSSLIADGIHSFSDFLTDIVSYIGSLFSNKKEDKEHPFGHGRLEYLTSIFIGIVVLFVGFTLIFKMSMSENTLPDKIVIVVSSITILLKYLLSSYLVKKGKQYDNQILLSSGYESHADVYSSLVVLVSSVLMQLGKVVKIFIYADKIAAIIVGILIVKTGFSILKENINAIIGRQEDKDELYFKVEKTILENPYIKRIDSLIIMKYGYYYSLTIEVSMDSDLTLKKAHDEIDKIENNIRKNERCRYIHIHMNPYDKN